MYFTSYIVMLVGVLKAAQCTAVISSPSTLIAEWLGLSVTVRVRVRARARECDFSVLFFLFSVFRECDFSVLFFFCVKVTNTFVLQVR